MAAADRKWSRERSDPGIQSGARAAMGGNKPHNPAYGVGDVIAAKYELVRPIRRGGMGEVWVARNTALDADVAVKLIRHERSTPEAAERLLTEARAVARLGHPSIVRVFDFGTTDGDDPYLVMELLEGEPLDQVLSRRTRLPAPNAVQTLLPLASALTAAHAEGIVHRDIKPDNILLVTDKMGSIVPKLLDFGIAKLDDGDAAGHITRRGVVLGSPAYMSPEQAIGDTEIDGRADIWSLCLVLYETIAGKLPFETDSYRKLVHQILTRDPVPLTDLELGDELLWAIVERGLSKDKGSRWATMRELGEALAKWTLKQGVKTDIAGSSIRRHWLGGSMAPAPIPSDSSLLLDPPAEEAAAAGAPLDDLSIALPPLAPAEPSVSMPRQLSRAVVVGGGALLLLVVAAIAITTSSSPAAPALLLPLGPALGPALQIEVDEPADPAAMSAAPDSVAASATASSAGARPEPGPAPGRRHTTPAAGHPVAPTKVAASAPPLSTRTTPPAQPGRLPMPATPDF